MIQQKVSPMKWITSEGGPLLLLDERELGNWGGAIDPIDESPPGESFSPGGFPTDYDRAGRVDGYLGRIPVRMTEALVFSDEPMPTTWVPAEFGGTIVRSWWFASSDQQLMEWLNEIPAMTFHEEGTFLVEGQRLLLFDSALPGRDVTVEPSQYLVLEMTMGFHNVKTAIYEPNAETSMVVHRFERI